MSGKERECASGKERESASGKECECASGKECECASGKECESASGKECECASGKECECASGKECESASGKERESASGKERESASHEEREALMRSLEIAEALSSSPVCAPFALQLFFEKAALRKLASHDAQLLAAPSMLPTNFLRYSVFILPRFFGGAATMGADEAGFVRRRKGLGGVPPAAQGTCPLRIPSCCRRKN